MRYILFVILLTVSCNISVYPQTVEDIATVYYINGQKPDNFEIRTPTPHLYLTQGIYQIEKEHDFKNGYQSLKNGINGYWSGLYYRYTFCANGVLVIFWVSLLLLYCAFGVIILRYYKSLNYRFFRTYYDQERSLVSRVVLSAVFLLFFVAGGWIIAACLIIKLMKKKELFIIIILTILTAVPLTLFTLFPQFYSYIKRPYLLQQLKIYDSFQIDYIIRDELKSLNEQDPNLPIVKLLLAKYYQNTASLYNDPNGNAVALDLYNASLGDGFALSLIHTNSGNIYFLKRDLVRARQEYEKALEKDTYNVYALYNMAQLYLVTLDNENFSKYYNQALLLAEQQGIVLPEPKKDSIILLDNEINKKDVWRYFLTTIFNMQQHDDIFQTGVLVFFTSFPFVLMLIGLLLSRHMHDLRSHDACDSCAIPLLPASARTKYMNKILCPDCGGMISEKTYSADLYKRKRTSYVFTAIKACLLNYIVPGSGMMYAGMTIWGSIITALALTIALPHIGSNFIFSPSIVDDIVYRSLFPLYALLQIVSIGVSLVYGLRTIRKYHG